MSSSSKELSKFEKEKQKLIQEKCQGMLNEMLRDDDNKYCVDCDAKGPRWASWNLGIFLCIRCAGIHRNLGVHISRVKSVNLDSWTPEQVVTMQQMGNSRARAVYEANLPDNFRRPQTDTALENFIRAKYEHTKYIAQEWVKPPPPRVDWNAEVEEQIRKKKEKKNAEATAILPKLGAASSTVQKKSPSVGKSSNHASSKVPPPIGKIEAGKIDAAAAAGVQVPPPSTSSASDDLLGLSTGSTSQVLGTDPFASPVKSTNNANATTAEEDLGGVFTAPADLSAQQKMTNQSILSLYGNLGAGGQQGLGAGIPGIAPNNPFAPQQFGGGVGGATTNPFPTSQQGIFGNELLGNGFAGGGGGPGGGQMLMGGTNPSQNLMMGNNISQLQQGIFSLQLGSAPPPQPPNSNNLLFTASSTSTPSNLNMMNPSPMGGFFGSTGAAMAQPPVPPMMQQQNLMNQQQFPPTSSMGLGLFQNGGSPAVGGSSNSSNVDLLWK